MVIAAVHPHDSPQRRDGGMVCLMGSYQPKVGNASQPERVPVIAYSSSGSGFRPQMRSEVVAHETRFPKNAQAAAAQFNINVAALATPASVSSSALLPPPRQIQC